MSFKEVDAVKEVAPFQYGFSMAGDGIVAGVTTKGFTRVLGGQGLKSRSSCLNRLGLAGHVPRERPPFCIYEKKKTGRRPA